jgi:arsenate reductase
MAEAFLNTLGGKEFEAESAGISPGVLNPYVVEAMKEAGIDISKNKTKSVFDFVKEGRKYDFVITVCDDKTAELCPVFPGIHENLHWNFPDPSTMEGTDEMKKAKAVEVMEAIRRKILQFIAREL